MAANGNATNANSVTAVHGNGENLYVSNNNSNVNFIRELEKRELAFNKIDANLKTVKDKESLDKIEILIKREKQRIQKRIETPNEHTSLFEILLNKYIDLDPKLIRLRKHFNYTFVPSKTIINRRGPNPYSKRKSARKTRRK
jgi:hypothetical protein